MGSTERNVVVSLGFIGNVISALPPISANRSRRITGTTQYVVMEIPATLCLRSSFLEVREWCRW